MKRLKYEIAVDYIRREYIDNESADGSIPSEPLLAKTLNMSRFPVNQAVSKLVEEGVLVRFDGIGTFVKGREPEIVKNKRHKLIGLISHVGAVNPLLLSALSKELLERGYFLANSFLDKNNNNFDYVIRKIKAMNIKGLFLTPCIHFGPEKSQSLELAERLSLAGLPPVCIVRPLAGYAGPRVLLDNAGGTASAMQWLMERGYRKIAYFGKNDYAVGQERFMGYRLGLEYSGMDYDESLIFLDNNGPHFVTGIDRFIEASIDKIFSRHPDCRAFVSFSVTFVYPLFRKLKERGIFKDDMIFAGYERLQHYDPDFSKYYLELEPPHAEIGRIAADSMFRQLEQTEPLREIKRVLPEMHLPGENLSLDIEHFRLLA